MTTQTHYWISPRGRYFLWHWIVGQGGGVGRQGAVRMRDTANWHWWHIPQRGVQQVRNSANSQYSYTLWKLNDSFHKGKYICMSLDVKDFQRRTRQKPSTAGMRFGQFTTLQKVSERKSRAKNGINIWIKKKLTFLVIYKVKSIKTIAKIKPYCGIRHHLSKQSNTCAQTIYRNYYNNRKYNG